MLVHSCCADEVAAQHVDADAIVHYGHACMSKSVYMLSSLNNSLMIIADRTYRIPVLYVFGKKDIDVPDCTHKLAESLREYRPSSDTELSSVILRHDVAYTHKAGL